MSTPLELGLDTFGDVTVGPDGDDADLDVDDEQRGVRADGETGHVGHARARHRHGIR